MVEGGSGRSLPPFPDVLGGAAAGADRCPDAVPSRREPQADGARGGRQRVDDDGVGRAPPVCEKRNPGRGLQAANPQGALDFPRGRVATTK